MAKASRDAAIDALRRLLGDAFALHQKGGAGARLGRAYGIADGYMLALIELGVATQKELTAVVAEERTRRLGRATQALSSAELPNSSDTLAA